MNKRTRDQLIAASNGIQNEAIGPWLADALDYIQSDGADDYEMVSRAVFFGLFLGRPEVVDQIILMQGKNYEKHLARVCAPKAKQVPLNDAIAFGRLQALKSPLQFDDELEGINVLVNLCSNSPSVDISIESIKVLRATFGDSLSDSQIEQIKRLIINMPAGLKKRDSEQAAVLEKNLTTNLAFGVFYAWSILERARLLEALD